MKRVPGGLSIISVFLKEEPGVPHRLDDVEGSGPVVTRKGVIPSQGFTWCI
jgi:hypothetical protein